MAGAREAAPRRAERRSDLRAAVVVFLAGALLLAVGLTGFSSLATSGQTQRWWHLLPLAAGCAVMLGKRRQPMLALGAGAALLAVDVLLGGSLGTVLVLVDLLYAAGLYASPRARRALLVVVVALILTSTVAGGLADDGRLRGVVAGALQGLAVLGVPLWWAADVRQKSELAALATEREALARAHAADVVRIADLRRRDAVQAERRAMARDLHDVVAGHVSAVAIRTGAALAGPGDRDRETLEFVRATSLTTLEEMRAMILLLRADPRDPGADGSPADDAAVASPGRWADLPELVRSHRSGGLDIVVDEADAADAAGEDPGAARAGHALPVAVDQAAFRIVQEALTNAAKHAGPGTVTVTARTTRDDLTLTVTNALPDAGPGRDAMTSAGIGLLTMRERAEALGGTFSAAPSGPRWHVHATLPLTERP